MKKITAFALILVALLSLCLTAFSDAPSAPPAGEISADLTHAEFIWRAPAQLTRDVTEKKIIYMNTSINKVSSTSVSIYGKTQTNAKAHQIYVSAVIQRWENNKWNNYLSYDYGTISSTSHEFSATKTVESGYYYRLACTHVATFTGDMSSYNSYTKSVYVN